MRPFVLLASLALLCAGFTLPADAQLFRRSYGTCASGNCGGSSYGYSTRMYATAPTASVPTSTPSTGYSAPRPSTYTVGESGQVTSPSGGVVKSIGGVEVVSKTWADARIREAEEAAMSYASIPECKDYSQELAEIKATLVEIKQRLPYREKQSSLHREIEEKAARLAADRAIVLAKIEGRRLAQR